MLAGGSRMTLGSLLETLRRQTNFDAEIMAWTDIFYESICLGILEPGEDEPTIIARF
jgi:hypothetical protein